MTSPNKLSPKTTGNEIKSGLLLQNIKKRVEQYLRFYPNKVKDVPYSSNNVPAHCEDNLEAITAACLEIFLNELKIVVFVKKTSVTSFLSTHPMSDKKVNANIEDVNNIVSSKAVCSLQKLVEDFEWLLCSTQMGDSNTTDIDLGADAARSCSHLNAQQFLRSWILHNLQSKCLSACLRTLVADKELLESHYTANAFLRCERFATAFCICLSALELHQYSLLSQVDLDLCTPMIAPGMTTRKRTSSQPDLCLAMSRNLTKTCESFKTAVLLKKVILSHPQTETSSFRKVQSLPSLPTDFLHRQDSKRDHSNAIPTKFARTSSKTISVFVGCSNLQPTETEKCTQVMKTSKEKDSYPSYTNSSDSYIGFQEEKPSTSSASAKQIILPESSFYFNSEQSPAYSNTTVASTNSSNSLSSSTSNSMTSSSVSFKTANRIELIKCDNIKIWTDHNWQIRQQQLNSQAQHLPTPSHLPLTNLCGIPKEQQPHSLCVTVKQSKSISPINNFLCHLFGTSPTYTSWSNSSFLTQESDTSNIGDSVVGTGIEERASYPCNTQQLNVSNLNSGMFDSFLPVYGKKLRSRKSQSIFDESGISTLDYSVNSAIESVSAENDKVTSLLVENQALPKNCQSLTTFLQMAHLSSQHNNTDLEKENAHFRISEAIISAIEHMKWSKQEREQKRCLSPQNDGEAATDWLEKDRSFLSKNRNKLVESLDNPSNEVNEHIPYVELEECSPDALSAEVVGLSLIAKFNDKHLPKVSELKWLVSEEDAPQELLPLPDTNVSSNPDENIVPSITRGTRYWAPPRQQIIFTDHPTPSRKDLIRKQNNRCTGCGMRVSPQYVQSFRYCTYLGKYHCTGCHRNQMSVIPSKILHSWDFKCYSVSVFAYRLLEQMYTYPLFRVSDLNPGLYSRSKLLLQARNKRVKLKFVKDFIRSCRFAVREQRYFDEVPAHITDDPEMWSIADFMDAQEKSMKYSIDELILRCENHIFNCVLCTARGFLCECCRKDQVIYPWDSKVFRCDHCGSCFHLKCWKSILEVCCRCQRITNRKIEMNEIAYELGSEENTQ